jgi:two-component system chemotaxis response regulator CheB
VVLVSSADTPETLCRVLTALPPTFPAAVVVIHGAPPEREQRLVASLAGHTRLPVWLARDGDRLVPGQVLVAPAGHQLLVAEGDQVRLVDVSSVSADGGRRTTAPTGQPASADLLLHTVGAALGPRSVTVLLAGQGGAGAHGAQAVRSYGGRVLVRGRPVDDEPAAGHPPPPPLTLDAIPAELVRICGG